MKTIRISLVLAALASWTQPAASAAVFPWKQMDTAWRENDEKLNPDWFEGVWRSVAEASTGKSDAVYDRSQAALTVKFELIVARPKNPITQAAPYDRDALNATFKSAAGSATRLEPRYLTWTFYGSGVNSLRLEGRMCHRENCPVSALLCRIPGSDGWFAKPPDIMICRERIPGADDAYWGLERAAK
ncbi:MAG: hypothetical protein HY553_00245 [Elusimicrobia bacterium]|nr:hypothetical protein [Elusimicrobiota bacterium]